MALEARSEPSLCCATVISTALSVSPLATLSLALLVSLFPRALYEPCLV